MLRKLYHPEVFQGTLRKKHYFEGWYFKHVTADQSRVVSFIPGISLDGNETHAFIQILDGRSGRSFYIRYSLNEFKWNRKNMYIRVGSSIFTEGYIRLDIASDEIKVGGQIDYSNVVKYPRSLFSPGIMGWYSFVPFMECKHGIISVVHDLSGKISLDGELTDFAGGKGYCEKDWGVSFPEGWIWVQSCNFPEHDTSFTLSIAKIPWLGSYFTGFICYVYSGKRFYLFSTYNKSIISEVIRGSDKIGITIKNDRHTLGVTIIKNSYGDLIAPVSGKMSRTIRESADSEVHLRLENNSGELIYTGNGKNAGLEIEEKVFDYI
jgi:tocopherol cyclase